MHVWTYITNALVPIHATLTARRRHDRCSLSARWLIACNISRQNLSLLYDAGARTILQQNDAYALCVRVHVRPHRQSPHAFRHKEHLKAIIYLYLRNVCAFAVRTRSRLAVPRDVLLQTAGSTQIEWIACARAGFGADAFAAVTALFTYLRARRIPHVCFSLGAYNCSVISAERTRIAVHRVVSRRIRDYFGRSPLVVDAVAAAASNNNVRHEITVHTNTHTHTQHNKMRARSGLNMKFYMRARTHRLTHASFAGVRAICMRLFWPHHASHIVSLCSRARANTPSRGCVRAHASDFN